MVTSILASGIPERVMRIIIAVAGPVTVGLFATWASGGDACVDKQLALVTAPTLVVQEDFGLSLDLSDDIFVVGAPGKKTVYVFESDGGGWQHTGTLVQGGMAGVSVATNGSQVFVGDDRAFLSGSGNPGAVRVYENDGSAWVLRQTLFASDAEDDDLFGRSIDVHEDTLIVGAPRLGPPEHGAAYVFELNGGTWAETGALVANDAIDHDHYGTDVAISDGVAVVGSPGANGIQPQFGALYVYERDESSWTQTAKLIAPQGQLGRNAAVDSGVIVGGAIDTAYTYEKIGPLWVMTSELVPSFGGTPDIVDLDIHAGRIVMGLPTDWFAGTEVGSALLFERVEGVWIDRMKLTPSDATQIRKMGERVAIRGDMIAAGAPFSWLQGVSDSGAAFLFSAQPNPSAEFGVACAGSSGVTPHLGVLNSYDGCLSLNSNVSFALTGGPPSAFAVLLVGVTESTIGIAGVCSLLVDPPGFSLVLPLLSNGSVSFGATVPTTADPGTVYLQAFTSDTGVPHGYAASNGLRLTIEE